MRKKSVDWTRENGYMRAKPPKMELISVAKSCKKNSLSRTKKWQSYRGLWKHKELKWPESTTLGSRSGKTQKPLMTHWSGNIAKCSAMQDLLQSVVQDVARKTSSWK
jgi:hypothetical protein